jgi:signal transduction histidine kinase
MRRSRADLIFHKENLEELVKMRTAELEKEITERKRAEEALQRHSEELAAANKELETFSYSVSHDLRAPLNAIRGLSDILMEDYSDKFNEDAKDLLKKITASTEKMSALINDILSLAKISRETMNCREIDLCPIAESVVNELRLAEPQRNIEIIIAAALSVFADAQLMRIALSNLIGNAWKYTGKNPSARIEIGAMTTENEHIFFVRDNGTGFPMSHAHKLFQPFQRLHSASQFPGTGIGLATVYKIILRHGGRIWAESEIDKGSTFYFTLKCKCRE